MTPLETTQLIQQGIEAMQNRDAPAATQYFSRVLEQEPGNLEALHAMASLNHAQGDFDGAAGLLERIIELQPDNAAAQNNLGILYQSRGQAKRARECYRNAIHAQQAFPEAWTNLGASMLMDNMYVEAEKCLGKALEIAPGYADAHFNLGKLYQTRGEDQKAMAAMRKTLEIQPAYAPAIAAMATLHDRNGETETALELLENARKAGHVSPEVALIFARISGQQGNTGIAQDLAASVANAQQLPAYIRAEAEFVLGDLCDRSKAWSKAVEHYDRGNHLKPQRFDMTAHLLHVDQLIAAFTPEAVEGFCKASITTDAPVFILGLPRSGKSCVEQLLASHPEVSGLGEFRSLRQIEHRMRKAAGGEASLCELLKKADVRQIDEHASQYLAEAASRNGSAARYVDNLPTNFLRVALIRQLFPGARIIECRRRQDDNALYCFFKNFSGADLAFTSEPVILVEYMTVYRQLMDHWKSLMDLEWMDIQYEDLVGDTERTARELIAFLGLEWDAQCLHYAERGIARLAEPPAVREPLDDREIGHARNYAAFMDLPPAQVPDEIPG